MKTTLLLFVYGTLRPQSRHPKARELARRARYLGPARMRGRIYALGRYPGVVCSCKAGEWVSGDLYLLPNAQLLRWLDAYEGCRGPHAQGPEYQRRRIAIQRAGKRGQLLAHTYVYRRPVRRLHRIGSGDWLSSE